MLTRWGIEVVSLYVGWEGDLVREDSYTDLDAFYERLRDTEKLPTTSQPSVGVPLSVRVPGMKPGTCHAPVSQTSLLSTLLELTGISEPSGLDGESLLPFLREPGRAQSKPVFSQFSVKSANAKQMIRLGDWKYSHYVKDTPELYNLREDPLEMNNLAGVAAHRDKEQELSSRSTSWHQPS